MSGLICCGILRRNCRNGHTKDQPAPRPTVTPGSSAESSSSCAQVPNPTNPNTRVNNQSRYSTTLQNAPPLSSTQAAVDSVAPSTSEPESQHAPYTAHIVEQEACDAPELPKPYASSSDMWREALSQLDESGKHKIEKLIGELDGETTNVKSLAVTVQEKIDAAFKAQQHDSKSERIIGSSLELVGKFLSVVDVAVSFDPVHAALPWAAVRSVLVLVTSNNELKSRLIAGIAIVASLLAQCDVYQQLYMVPDPTLRPSEISLSMLKTAIVQTYTKAQLFLSFAVEQQHGKLRLAAAAFKVGDAESHIDKLSQGEKELSRASDTCERHCNLSNRSAVQELLRLKEEFSKIFQDQMNLLMDRINDRDQIKLLEWISRIPYGEHHERMKDARTSGTCEWLLRHNKFRRWEAFSLSTVLWLQGSPGAGKTFLASKVVDYRRDLLERSPNQQGLAFFYCDRNEEERRKPLSILRSFVRQLSTTIKNPDYIRTELRDCYRKARSNGSGLSFKTCKEQLLESINLYSQTTLVLDALDECEPNLRGQILEVIEDLISRSENGLKIFISSRPDRDIKDRFLKTPNIEIQATDNEEDIQKFVREKIVLHGNWKDMSQDLRDTIVEKLYAKSQGMFQWAFLQINELLGLETESAIRSRLGNLPADLKIAYDEIYTKIKARDKHDRALADRAFKWVACAKSPLDSVKLLPAIRLGSNTTALDLSDTITESQLLHLCNNLLVIDSSRNVWRFSHLSVTEYFEANHWDLQDANCHAANVCLKVLLHSYRNVGSGGNNDTVSNAKHNLVSSRIQSNPFERPLQDYAGYHWISHIRDQEKQESDSVLAHLLKSFLGSPTESSLQYRAWMRQGLIYHKGPFLEKSQLKPATTALFSMCRFSLYRILLDWWEDEEFDISAITSDGNNLLSLAVAGGCNQICENLIGRGIQVDMQLQHTRYGSALAAAAYYGHTETVKLLSTEGKAEVDMQLQNGTYGSALATAAARGHTQIVKFLVEEAGADVNLHLQFGEMGSALVAAVWKGQVSIAKYLVNNAGANPNMQVQNGEYGSALVAAIFHGEIDIVKYLINDAGADPNMHLQCGVYGSALAVATSCEYYFSPLIDTLLKAGAEVNMQLQYGCFGNALISTIAHGLVCNVQYLVNDAKADVDQQIQNGMFGSALAAAVFYGRKDCADILIKAGADVNLRIQNGEFRTAMQAAQGDLPEDEIGRKKRESGRAEVVELLKLHGATDDIPLSRSNNTYCYTHGFIYPD
ncbi:hypothetical protein F4678DRAFT_449592 [Xylaria arbuscula]|nr:hypothetical protein F4678DRAFT_449592 [Xylaria arbuscula]